MCIFKKISSIPKLNLTFLYVYLISLKQIFKNLLLLSFHTILNLTFYIPFSFFLYSSWPYHQTIPNPNKFSIILQPPPKKNVSLHSKIIHFTVKFNVFTYKSLFSPAPPRTYTKVSIQKSENRGKKCGIDQSNENVFPRNDRKRGIYWPRSAFR